MSDPLATPYVSLADADTFNAGNATWDAASDDEKNDALFNGRMYIDTRYTFTTPIDEDDAPQAVQQANATLGIYYLENPTDFFALPADYGLSEKRVRADTVESKRKYSPAFLGTSLDKYPDITALLSPYMYFSSGNAAHPIVRQ